MELGSRNLLGYSKTLIFSPLTTILFSLQYISGHYHAEKPNLSVVGDILKTEASSPLFRDTLFHKSNIVHTYY